MGFLVCDERLYTLKGKVGQVFMVKRRACNSVTTHFSWCPKKVLIWVALSSPNPKPYTSLNFLDHTM